MYYWNQTNFNGLNSLGAMLATEPDLALLGQYCLLREQGLRKQAVAAALAFTNHLTGLATVTQRAIAVLLIELKRANPGVHQLLPHPVKIELHRILSSWHQDASDDVVPLINLGLLTDEIDYFEAALQRQPNEQTSLIRLAQAYLGEVEYQAHHLSESFFIGTVEQAEESLHKAEALIIRVANTQQRDALNRELQAHQLLISDWATYAATSRTEPFTTWSQARGHTYMLPSIVYYRK